MSPKPFTDQHNRMNLRGIPLALAISFAWILIGLAIAHARPTDVKPQKAPQSLLRARQACPNTATPTECRAALRRAYEAASWQKKERHKLALNQHGYGVMHALRIAAAVYGINLAQFIRVARCESHLNPRAKNRSSTATGLMQWLDGSWRTQGLPGFDRTDPYASALAAGRAVQRDGGWSQWVCKP